MRATFALLFPLFLLVGGCATLNESDCGQGDWFGIGANDAFGGYTPDRINQHAKACGKYAITPDYAQYEQGYARGLLDFCTPPRGFEFGRGNNTYYRQCPPELETGFLLGWELGNDVYLVEQDISAVDGRISDLRKELKNTEITEESRNSLERQLDRTKDERDHRSRDRDRLLERARQRGYGNVW